MHELASRTLFAEQTRGFTRELAASRGWEFLGVEYPIIDVTFSVQGRTALRLRMVCDDWNEKPPSFELLKADGTPHASPWPPGGNPSSIFHAGPHEKTGRPFICMRGSREYHIHSSHINDHWDSHRANPDNTLGGLLHQVWLGWSKGND